MIFKFFLFLAYSILNSECLSDKAYFRPTQQEILNPNETPVRSIYGIKSIQTDYWNIDDFVGNGAGGAAINYLWASNQPTLKYAPCGSGEEEYDGQCFRIDSWVDQITRDYSNRNLIITGVLIGVPDWARVNNFNCKLQNKIFCAPDNGHDFGRFAGWLAKRYNGKNGNGRIVEFVIHNEVNAAEWFNVGCGFGTPCNMENWVSQYASSYISSFDEIRKHQPKAPVLISLEHHFDFTFDLLISAQSPVMSGKTFIQKLVPKLGSRDWALAYHSYPPSLLHTAFSAGDLPKITFGNINILVGWLMSTYPNTPSAWKVYLTENGINSLAPYATDEQQKTALCQAFQNIINTPFIENFVYHRMKDHPDETKDGLGLGLVNVNNQYKPAWSVWALSNRFDIPNSLNCGFETLPYLVLKVGFKVSFGHWTTTRYMPIGYNINLRFKIFREYQANTRLIFECKANDRNNLVSVYMNCENQFHLGPLGYVFTTQQPNTVPLVRCINPNNGDHFVSTNSNCDGFNYEEILGYAYLA